MLSEKEAAGEEATDVSGEVYIPLVCAVTVVQ